MPNEPRPTAQDNTATPGPWEAYPFDESQTAIYGPEYDGGKRELVAVVSVGAHRPHGHANARLIAAAPLMLEALKADEEHHRLIDLLKADETQGEAVMDVWAQIMPAYEKFLALRKAALAAAAPPTEDRP